MVLPRSSASQLPPLGVEPFDDEDYEEQCLVSSFWTASRLLVIASVFLYGTFAFAYFYLRALNTHNEWRVAHETPSTAIGSAVAVCVVLAALVSYVGARRLQVGSRWDFEVSAVASIALTAVAAGLQIWDLTRLPFSPSSSGYASVFVAWMPVYIAYMLGQMYWLEVLVAQAIRRPHTVLAETEEGMLVVSRYGANVEGYVLFSEFMVVASVFIWIVFYAL